MDHERVAIRVRIPTYLVRLADACIASGIDPRVKTFDDFIERALIDAEPAMMAEALSAQESASKIEGFVDYVKSMGYV